MEDEKLEQVWDLITELGLDVDEVINFLEERLWEQTDVIDFENDDDYDW